MNGKLLRARLHLDQVELWKEVEGLLASENQSQSYSGGGDITAEYYLNLLVGIMEELGKEVPKDSIGIQTELEGNDPEIWDFLEKLENENRVLEDYKTKVSDFRSYVPGSGFLSDVCMEGLGFSGNTTSSLIKSLEFCRNPEVFRKSVELLERKDNILKDIIGSQNTMLLSLRDINLGKKPELRQENKFKIQEDKDSKLRNELESYKSENERLRIRVELYKSELARIYNQKESSSSNL